MLTASFSAALKEKCGPFCVMQYCSSISTASGGNPTSCTHSQARAISEGFTFRLSPKAAYTASANPTYSVSACMMTGDWVRWVGEWKRYCGGSSLIRVTSPRRSQ